MSGFINMVIYQVLESPLGWWKNLTTVWPTLLRVPRAGMMSEQGCCGRYAITASRNWHSQEHGIVLLSYTVQYKFC